jgi:transposase
MEVHGIGPAGAARILADVGDIARFTDRNRFASWTGTAPLDASSGEQIRHRLSRAGNRRMNHVVHIAAIVQLRHDTEGRAYYRRKLAAGKTPSAALPQATHLRRHLPPLVTDARATEDRTAETGPGGPRGATQEASTVDVPPHIDTSDQPLPGPATPTLRPTPTTRKSPDRQAFQPAP